VTLVTAGFDIDYVPSGKTLTGQTWADHHQGVSPERPISWPVESDLAQQLWKMDGHKHLRYQEWRLLLAAATSGLPVVVTWDTPVNLVRSKIERITRTVVVRYLTAPSLDRPDEMPVRVRAAYSGFCHDIPATDIHEVAPPPTPDAEYLDVKD
jgi:hypothetical protein